MSTLAFSDRLLQWWDVHGRKDLPWQHPRTPYRVWVSEIMLQQTQVATVIPFFDRFIQRFPDLATLARASQDDVLALWAGLGYYARGRNLHKAAGMVMERFEGEFPDDARVLASLPGIGRSTANAIISQAWDRPATVVDGNVRRVMARHAGIDDSAGKSSTEKVYWAKAENMLPHQRGADYTQAIMDLGATLCTRSRPGCKDCPVSNDCHAYLSGTTNQFPAKPAGIKVSDKRIHMLIIAKPDGRVLLEKRPPTGIWGGLWSLPEEEDEQRLASRFGFLVGQFSALPDMEHRLTHMRINIRPRTIVAEAKPNGVESTTDQRWFDAGEWSSAGLPKPVKTLLKLHQQEYIHDAHR